ncbi:relaxase/mobilization nuclease domain-containing protein, partial [Proteus mirabilis]
QGDPDLSLAIAEASPFKNAYTVGCLSFEEVDLPGKDKQEIMQRFEETLFAGLESEQYNISWVEHRDKGRLELNFFIPNTELSTGKRLQPYYDRADRHLTDNFKKVINHEYGLSDPDSIEKKQLLQLNSQTPKSVNETKKEIANYFAEKVGDGLISERSQVEQTLEAAGYEITRKTGKSISIKNPHGERNIRLSGEIFSEEFYGQIRDVKQSGQSLAEARERNQERERSESQANYQRALEKLGSGVKARQERFKGLYPRQNGLGISDNSHHLAVADSMGVHRLASQTEAERLKTARESPSEHAETGELERVKRGRNHRQIRGLSTGNDQKQESRNTGYERVRQSPADTEKQGLMGFFNELQTRIKTTVSRAREQIEGIRELLRGTEKRESEAERLEQASLSGIKQAERSLGSTREHQQHIRETERAIKRANQSLDRGMSL